MNSKNQTQKTTNRERCRIVGYDQDGNLAWEYGTIVSYGVDTVEVQWDGTSSVSRMSTRLFEDVVFEPDRFLIDWL